LGVSSYQLHDVLNKNFCYFCLQIDQSWNLLPLKYPDDQIHLLVDDIYEAVQEKQVFPTDAYFKATWWNEFHVRQERLDDFSAYDPANPSDDYIDVTGYHGQPLVFADFGTFNYLYHLGAYINSEEMLHFAIKYGGQRCTISRNSLGQTPLHMASMNGGDVSSLRRVICDYKKFHNDSEGTILFDVDLADFSGRRPIGMAASLGHSHVVGELIAAGAKVHNHDRLLYVKYESLRLFCSSFSGNDNEEEDEDNINNNYDETSENSSLSPMFWYNNTLGIASTFGHLGVLEVLKENGCDFRYNDPNVAPALLLAVCNKHMEVAKFLLQSGADPDCQLPSNFGMPMITPLCLAAHHGEREWAELLLHYKADVDKMGGQYTPIFYSLLELNGKMTSLLIENGANVNQAHTTWGSVLELCCINGTPENLILCLSKGANHEVYNKVGDSTIHTLCSIGDVEKMETYLQFCSRAVNLKNHSGETALFIAVREGNCDMANILIRHGADVNATDTSTGSLLHIAKMGKRHSWLGDCDYYMLHLLLTSGAKKEICDEKGRTAFLHKVANREHLAAIYLMENGAGVWAKDVDGLTALILIVQNCVDRRIITDNEKILLDELTKNVDYMQSVDNHGNDALDYAVSKLMYRHVSYLLDRGMKIRRGLAILYPMLDNIDESSYENDMISTSYDNEMKSTIHVLRSRGKLALPFRDEEFNNFIVKAIKVKATKTAMYITQNQQHETDGGLRDTNAKRKRE
jgi:ankyrin repeat protein